MSSLRILFLESFFGGSHRAFAEGFQAHSKHAIDIVTLPARFWKWRMRGAALELLQRIDTPEAYDLIWTGSLLDLTDLKALWPGTCPPAILYFHENQLLYPLAPGEERDFHYGFTNITSALAADRTVFNSWYHHEAFFAELPAFIAHLPDCRPSWAVDVIRSKSLVLHPGIHIREPDPRGLDPCLPKHHQQWSAGPADESPEPADTADPVILWNHRWEHDKNPELFFRTLFQLRDKGTRFKLIAAGEQFSRVPAIFQEARRRLRDEIISWGYLEQYSDYVRALEAADIVVSTSNQENFGISMVEAMSRGCLPVAPRRLSYPEIIPPELHPACLYECDEELLRVLSAALSSVRSPAAQEQALRLRQAMRRFSWDALIEGYDRLCEETAGSKRRR